MEQATFNFAVTEQRHLTDDEQFEEATLMMLRRAEDGATEYELSFFGNAFERMKGMKTIIEKDGKWRNILFAAILLFFTGCTLPRPRSVEVKTQYFNVSFELEQQHGER
jgi:hypothetical protein